MVPINGLRTYLLRKAEQRIINILDGRFFSQFYLMFVDHSHFDQ